MPVPADVEVALISEDGVALESLKFEASAGTMISASVEKHTIRANLRVRSLSCLDGTPFNINSKFEDVSDNLTISLVRGKINFSGLTATVYTPPTDTPLTEKYTPPQAKACKYGHAQARENAYGAVFVAAAIKTSGSQLRTEWVPKDEFELSRKISKLMQDRALLNDDRYFEGRGGDDDQNRRIPTRLKKRKVTDNEIVDFLELSC